MSEIVRGERDGAVEALKQAMDEYEAAHPGAVANLYRQNVASIRIRVVDPRFKKMSRPDRHDELYDFLADRVSNDVLNELSILLPLAPSEQPSSFMNFEFDEPVPSGY